MFIPVRRPVQVTNRDFVKGFGLALVFLTALGGMLGADSRQLRMEYHSVPEGADVYETSKFIGKTPFPVTYLVSEYDQNAGVVQLTELKFVWPDGQVQTVSPRVSLNTHGYSQVFTLRAALAIEDDEGYSQALGEYQQAFAEWEKARKDLDDYVALRRTYQTLGTLDPPNKALQAINNLGSIADPLEISSLQRAVDVAKIKLDMAISRLNQYGGRFGGATVNTPPTGTAPAPVPAQPAPPQQSSPPPSSSRNQGSGTFEPSVYVSLGGSPLGSTYGQATSGGFLSFGSYRPSLFYLGSEIRIISAAATPSADIANNQAHGDILVALGVGGNMSGGINGGIYGDFSGLIGLAILPLLDNGFTGAIGLEGGVTAFLGHLVLRIDIPAWIALRNTSAVGTSTGYIALDASVGYGW